VNRFRFMSAGALLCLGLTVLPSLSSAQAPAYPSKPLRLLVSNPPGGTVDTLARAVAEGLTQNLGQTVVVENKPGVNGNIAADLVAKAPADGHTLLMTPPGPLTVNAVLYSTLPFDPDTAFAPVSEVAIAPLVLVVPKALPVHDLKELLAYMKANPAKANFASQGNASSGHLAMELLKSRTGLAAAHVPYKGSAPALNDLLGGNVSMMFDNVTSSLPQIRAGALRAIAVAERTRLQVLPDVPTVEEQGVPGFELTPWFGIVTTGGTPAPVVEKLSRSVADVLNSPAVRKRFESIGVELRPSSPSAFGTYIKAQSTELTRLVKASGAKAD